LFVSDNLGDRKGKCSSITWLESAPSQKSPHSGATSKATSKKDTGIPNLIVNPIMLVGFESFVKNDPQFAAFDQSDADWESQISNSPKDPSIWIKWAICRLPEPVFSKSSNESISILGRALQSFRNDASLWAFYLEIYSRRGNTRDVRAIFKQALSDHSFVRSNQFIWWRWYIWEEEVSEKLSVMKQFLAHVMEEQETAFDSCLFVEVVIEIANLYTRLEHKAKGINFIHKILCAKKGNIKQVITELGDTWEPSGHSLDDVTKSWTYQNIPTRLFYFMWTYYVHQVFYEGEDLVCQTREKLFYAYPYNFKLVDPAGALFEINWNLKNPEDVSQEMLEDLRYTTGYLHNGVKGGADQVLYLTVLRNCVGFLAWEGKIKPASEVKSNDISDESLNVGGSIDSEIFDAALRFQLYQVCHYIQNSRSS
jgi:hypothetical protein